jgi:hypothetical protein
VGILSSGLPEQVKGLQPMVIRAGDFRWSSSQCYQRMWRCLCRVTSACGHLLKIGLTEQVMVLSQANQSRLGGPSAQGYQSRWGHELRVTRAEAVLINSVTLAGDGLQRPELPEPLYQSLFTRGTKAQLAALFS